MGYARQVYTQAENELNRRRTTAQDNAQRRLENFYAVCPEAEDVRRRIASTASRAAMAVLRSGNARETFAFHTIFGMYIPHFSAKMRSISSNVSAK